LFSATNDEPLATALYLDWISNPENLMCLQTGENMWKPEDFRGGFGIGDGYHLDKSIEAMISSYNIDCTLVLNGLDLGDAAMNINALAGEYPGVATKAYKASIHDGRVEKHMNYKPEDNGRTDEALNLVCFGIIADPNEDFDELWDGSKQLYLDAMGGQAVLDEREAMWQRLYGDATQLPFRNSK
jgi:putative aldouronate transport system substrate-binding protein